MKQINKKRMITSLIIATLTVAMLGVFVIRVSASTEYEMDIKFKPH